MRGLGATLVMARVAWVQLSAREPLFWKWLLLKTLLVALPTLILFHFRLGLLGLGGFVLGALVWPVTVEIRPQGVRLRTLGVQSLWSADSIERIRMVDAATPRRWRVLEIERRAGRVARVFASAAVLLELEAAALQAGLSGAP